MKGIFGPYVPVMPEIEEPGGPLPPPPIFGRSVNPIPTGEGRLFPLITTGTPNVFHLPASLHRIKSSNNILKLDGITFITLGIASKFFKPEFK